MAALHPGHPQGVPLHKESLREAKEDQAWTVLAHDKGWMGIKALSREGVPDEVARRLMDQIDPNWASYEVF